MQGYAYEAAVSGAALLEAFGLPGGEAYRNWAAELATKFRERFWCGTGDDRFPALALDGHKERVDALTSNIGHLLGTGLLDPDEELAVARHLAGPELDSGWGLRTMSSGAGAYAPLSYHCGSVWPHDTAIAVLGLHRAGLGAYAGGLVEGMLRAAVAFEYRLPELWSGEGAPVPYPASCRPQAWSAAAAVTVATVLGSPADVTAPRERTLGALPNRWRWRESNPRPRATNQDFSGRSWLSVFLAPALAPARCRQAQPQLMSLLSPETTLSR